MYFGWRHLESQKYLEETAPPRAALSVNSVHFRLLLLFSLQLDNNEENVCDFFQPDGPSAVLHPLIIKVALAREYRLRRATVAASHALRVFLQSSPFHML